MLHRSCLSSMLMRGGGGDELFMLSQPGGQVLAFPVTIATSGSRPGRARAVTRPRGVTEMPSGGGNPPCVRCARHGRLALQVQPCAKWTRETRSFVTQMYLTISCSSWKTTGCFGKLVQLLMFPESIASFHFMVTIMCNVLLVFPKTPHSFCF